MTESLALRNMNFTPPDPVASSCVPAKKSVQRQDGSLSTNKTAVSKGKTPKDTDPQLSSNKQVSLHAYYIGERRRNLGLPGDETSDWLQAEREISQESECYEFAASSDDVTTAPHHHTER